MNKLAEIAVLFFKMGLTAFGGPAAHIAIMESEVVSKRKWLTRQHFLDLVGATNLIPGPNSTEMTMHCGYVRAGYPGLIVAGMCFILPACALTLLVAYLYQQFGNLDVALPLLDGIRVAVLVILAEALIKLTKKAVINKLTAIIGIGAVVAYFFAVPAVWIVLSSGLLYGIMQRSGAVFSLLPMALSVPALTTSSLFFTFLKIGSVLFGSGYVLIAYLDAELVQRLGWLTPEVLLDAVAMGQFTPGPVLSTATFVGYVLDGPMGALAATAGMFLPSFVFAGLLAPAISAWSSKTWLRPILNGLNAGSVGLMAAAAIQLSIDAYVGWTSIVILAVVLFFRFGPKKISALWLIPVAAVLSYLLGMIA